MDSSWHELHKFVKNLMLDQIHQHVVCTHASIAGINLSETVNFGVNMIICFSLKSNLEIEHNLSS